MLCVVYRESLCTLRKSDALMLRSDEIRRPYSSKGNYLDAALFCHFEGRSVTFNYSVFLQFKLFESRIVTCIYTHTNNFKMTNKCYL